MFLNKDEFHFNGELLTVYELSALQRIELLEYLTKEEKAQQANDVDESETAQSARLVSFNIRAGARVVAMSLWQGTDKSVSVDELHQQVLETWPVAAIGKADTQVKILSGMLPPTEEVDPEPLRKS